MNAPKKHLTQFEIIDQFRNAMAAAGVPCSGTITPDKGKLTRFSVDGDKRHSRTGWYILYTDGIPAGGFGCWKRGITSTWCAEVENELTDEERKELAAKRELMERIRREEQERMWAEAEVKANEIWNASTPAIAHPYLTRKGVKAYGLRVGRWTRTNEDGEVWLDIPDALIVPIKTSGKIVSLQAIFPSNENPLHRDKDTLKGGKKRGCYFFIGQAVPDAPDLKIVFCEGYATGATIHAATGYLVIVCFDAGNLEPVATHFRKAFPQAQFIIAADNDRWTTKPIPNPGVHYANLAAKNTNAVVRIPDFPDLTSKPTDYNDLQGQSGLQAVADSINDVVAVVPANDNPPPQPTITPEPVAKIEAMFAGCFSVLGRCAEHRIWIRDDRTNELRAFKESELSKKSTLLSLASLDKWELIVGAHSGAKFTPDAAYSLILDVAKAKPRYQKPVAKLGSPENLTGSHAADSAVIANMMRQVTLYDEYSQHWYKWDLIWRRTTEGAVQRDIISMLDDAFQMQYNIDTFNGTYNMLKRRLGRSPQMNSDTTVVYDTWNRDKNLLPMRNGVLNLRTKELIPHSPELMMPWFIPHDYKPTASCHRINHFLFTLAQGDEDTQTVLLCYLAAILHGRYDLQKYIEIIGIAGTGKSTFISICQALVGDDNIVTTTMEQLNKNRFETATLYGKRLVIISDADKYGGAVDIFKAITGSDPIRYEEKQKQATKPFVYSGMVVVAANQPLQFTDSSTAMVRRRIPIHIDKRLDPKLVDVSLKEKLADELPGLINLLLTISQETITEKLGNYKGLRRAAEMRAMCETNNIAEWLNERCIANDKTFGRIGTSKNPADDFLYSNYALFCEETGRRGAQALQNFTRAALDVLGYCGIKAEKGVTMHGKVIKGIRLRTQMDDHIPTMLTNEPVVGKD